MITPAGITIAAVTVIAIIIFKGIMMAVIYLKAYINFLIFWIY